MSVNYFYHKILIGQQRFNRGYYHGSHTKTPVFYPNHMAFYITVTQYHHFRSKIGPLNA